MAQRRYCSVRASQFPVLFLLSSQAQICTPREWGRFILRTDKGSLNVKEKKSRIWTNRCWWADPTSSDLSNFKSVTATFIISRLCLELWDMDLVLLLFVLHSSGRTFWQGGFLFFPSLGNFSVPSLVLGFSSVNMWAPAVCQVLCWEKETGSTQNPPGMDILLLDSPELSVFQIINNWAVL